MAVLSRLPVLVINAGSATLKLHLVEPGEQATAIGTLESVDRGQVKAVAHRLVHGGSRLREPVIIDAAVRRQILELEALAPLHNAPALAAIEQATQVFPDVPQVAVFDTAFHATIPEEAGVYTVPRAWREDWGIRRYGFHGLSVAWSVERAATLLARPVDGLRLVICHLGGGSSVTAVRHGQSVDTTMGFSPLEGVPMATRSGSLDPGILVYLMREHGLSADALEHALNFESGLKGLAGHEGDMRMLERAAQAGDRAAVLAIQVFINRVAAAIAAMAAAVAGLDALVFTGGVGENSAIVRAGVCGRLSFLGIRIDASRNTAGALDEDLATAGSPVRVLVIRAREEIIAARAVWNLLRPARG